MKSTSAVVRHHPTEIFHMFFRPNFVKNMMLKATNKGIILLSVNPPEAK